MFNDIMEKAANEPDFRKKLLVDPKAAVKDEMGVDLSEEKADLLKNELESVDKVLSAIFSSRVSRAAGEGNCWQSA